MKILKLIKRIFLGSPNDVYCKDCYNYDHHFKQNILGLVGAYIGAAMMIDEDELA